MKITRTEIVKALELLQEAMDAKHTVDPESEDAMITIRLTNSPLASDATDTQSTIMATGIEEIADYLASK